MATDLKKPGEAAGAEEPETLDLHSMDVTEKKRQELLRLFPEAGTEGGKIDFDRLRLALGETIDVGRERYGMTWPGKADCFRTIQTPSIGTLLPGREESVHFDTTENLIIEGDNLEVLKLLQKSYLGKVKMIYIDPPYNTGNDFIYPDNYSESLQTYLEYTGQIDDEGRRFGTNTETDGRFHSKWMNMMYPRLYLARNLMREDGVIFISIGEHEFRNLRYVMDDVFGEENFIATVIWQKVFAVKNSAEFFSASHDFILVYARSGFSWARNLLARSEEQTAEYDNPDNDLRGAWISVSLSARNPYSQGLWGCTTPSGRVIDGPPVGRYWTISFRKFEDLIADNRITWGKDGGGIPRRKVFLAEVQQGIVPETLWMHDEVGNTQEAKKELLSLVKFSSGSVFETPKPTRLIKRMLALSTQSHDDEIILDFFAGSGSTADAVARMNREDYGNRKFILVQLPELTGRDDYKTIAEITKERVRRVIKKLDDEDAGKLDLNGGKKQDRGFRVFKLAESNLKTWNADAPKDDDELGEQLELHVDHIRPGRTQEDILFEILLKSGYPLTARVEELEMAEKKIFSIAEGALLVCLENALTIEVIRAMAEAKPERVVCLDAGFAGNDQLKTNAVQIFKTLHHRGDEAKESPDVTVFRTV